MNYDGWNSYGIDMDDEDVEDYQDKPSGIEADIAYVRSGASEGWHVLVDLPELFVGVFLGRVNQEDSHFYVAIKVTK